MSKRQADQDEDMMQQDSKAVDFGTGRNRKNDLNEMGEFEDAWEDDFEQESGDEQDNQDQAMEGDGKVLYISF